MLNYLIKLITFALICGQNPVSADNMVDAATQTDPMEEVVTAQYISVLDPIDIQSDQLKLLKRRPFTKFQKVLVGIAGVSGGLSIATLLYVLKGGYDYLHKKPEFNWIRWALSFLTCIFMTGVAVVSGVGAVGARVTEV